MYFVIGSEIEDSTVSMTRENKRAAVAELWMDADDPKLNI